MSRNHRFTKPRDIVLRTTPIIFGVTRVKGLTEAQKNHRSGFSPQRLHPPGIPHTFPRTRAHTLWRQLPLPCNARRTSISAIQLRDGLTLNAWLKFLCEQPDIQYWRPNLLAAGRRWH